MTSLASLSLQVRKKSVNKLFFLSSLSVRCVDLSWLSTRGNNFSVLILEHIPGHSIVCLPQPTVNILVSFHTRPFPNTMRNYFRNVIDLRSLLEKFPVQPTRSVASRVFCPLSAPGRIVLYTYSIDEIRSENRLAELIPWLRGKFRPPPIPTDIGFPGRFRH